MNNFYPRSYMQNNNRFIGPALPFVGGLLVGGLFAPPKGGIIYNPPPYGPMFPPPIYPPYPQQYIMNPAPITHQINQYPQPIMTSTENDYYVYNNSNYYK